MAYAASPPSPLSSTINRKHGYTTWKKQISIDTTARRKRVARLCVFATVEDASKKRQRPPSEVDTRIHWENDDEGWVGGNSSKAAEEQPEAETVQENFLGDKFSELLYSSDSHYQFLGVPPNADLEEIKSAYRRLTKEYHPDTTSLPIKTASEKFMRLREIYNTLSDDESRRFYDWTLAQEAASLQAEKMRMKLEDPFMQDFRDYEPVPDMVDRLGGKNLKLSDQAVTALTFDIFAIIVSLGCIIYAIFFKEY